ncbi:MAG TPA: response regulator, partial [Bacteroidia bacterium]|nr:response regulator [Bacteroidia bacterium]
ISEIDYWFSGGGEMGERIRNFDWSQTPIGAPDQWSESLKNTLSLMLYNRFPMILWWGKQYVQFYNDPYIPIPGMKHPLALGQKANVCWEEIWKDIGPLIDAPFNGGPSTWMDDILLKVNRKNFVEETHFVIAYSPVPDPTVPNGIGGVLATVNEITGQVLNERAIETLSKLGSYTIACKTKEEVYEKTALALSENQYDFPFSMLYKINDEITEAELAATGNIAMGSDASPGKINLETAKNTWNIKEAISAQKTLVLGQLSSRFGSLPKGNWEDSPEQAVITPVTLQGKVSVVLITGINPYLKIDERYKNLIQLLSKQLEQALFNVNVIQEERKRTEALEELNRAKTVFFSNISHEFRTPLTLMLGPLEELLNKPGNSRNDHEREILEITHRNAMRLLKLVNSLLDFSRIEAGRQKASFELEDIVSITRELASNFTSIIEKAGLKLEIEAASFIQPVYIDKEMWEKIIFNLLSNAFKYTLKGKITVRIYPENNHAVIEVIDTGIGIAKQEQSKVFERFHRTQNSMGRSFEGTGIGLSLVKELVALHGGVITLTSSEGKGSVFTVKVPFGRNHLKEDAIRKNNLFDSELVKQSFIEHGNSLLLQEASDNIIHREDLPTVLVVDDNTDMRQYLVKLLKTKYNVVTAVNGLDALHHVQKKRPDIIISDIMMPIKDGFEMMKELRAQESSRHIPIIILSARAGEEATVEGVDAGANDYLIKPFSAKELLARVASHIQMRDERKRASEAMGLERKRLYDLFMQAPAAIAVLRGPSLVFEIANPLYLEIAGKKEDILGKPILEAIPELKGQPIEKIIFNVFKSGKAYIGKEVLVKYVKNNTGIPEEIYFNFVYQPFIAENDMVDGVMVHAVDVTDHVKNKKKLV